MQSHLVNLSFSGGHLLFCLLHASPPPTRTSSSSSSPPPTPQASSVVSSGGTGVSSASLPGAGDSLLPDGDYWWRDRQRSRRRRGIWWQSCCYLGEKSEVGLCWQRRVDRSVLLLLPEWVLKKASAGMKDDNISEEIAKVFCVGVRRTCESRRRFFRLILCHCVGAWSPWWVTEIKDKKKKIIAERINLKIEFKLNFLKQSVIIRFGCFIDSVMQPS